MTTLRRRTPFVVMFGLMTFGAGSSAARLALSADAAAPPRTILLRGQVLGLNDRPVAGARLFLNVDEGSESVELGRCGDDGRYRFDLPEWQLRRAVASGAMLAKCQASLIAIAEGLAAGWELLPDVDGGRYGEMKSEYVHDFRLSADFPIEGTVVDVSGKPVAGAAVAVRAVHDLSDERWWKMPTAIKARDMTLMSRREIDVNNWFTPLYRTAWHVLPPAITDANGRFRIAGIGRGLAVSLEVNGPGIRSALVGVLTRDDVDDFTRLVRDKYPRTPDPNGYLYPRRGEPVDGGVLLFGPSPTIEVDPARTISGVVRDAATGEPLAGIRLQTADSYGAGRAVTDRHGRYCLPRADDDDSVILYNYQHQPERFLTVARRITDAKRLGNIVANIDLPRGVVINGRVVEADTGKPIAAAARHGCHDVGDGPLQAGVVSYYPLAANTELRDAPAGLYFQGFQRGKVNWSISAAIDGEGRFRLAVPPGPGVLLVNAVAPLPMLVWVWNESAGLHRLFPYVELAGRTTDDGAGGDDVASFPGLSGAIPLKHCHAYRVIAPPADTTTLDLTLSVPRAPSSTIRFVDPDGQAIRGVTVRGLVAKHAAVVLKGAEAQVNGLAPGEPRSVIAYSNDRKYAGRTVVSTDDADPKIMRLELAASLSGRLLDSSTNRPLAGYRVWANYPKDAEANVPRTDDPAKTGDDGRFLIDGLMSGIGVSLSFEQPKPPFMSSGLHRPDAVGGLALGAGEVRDVGDIHVKPVTAKAPRGK